MGLCATNLHRDSKAKIPGKNPDMNKHECTITPNNIIVCFRLWGKTHCVVFHCWCRLGQRSKQNTVWYSIAVHCMN